MQILKDYVPYGSTTWWTQQGYSNGIPTLMGWSGTAHSMPMELKVRGAAMNAFALAMVDPKNIVTARLLVALTSQHVSQNNTAKPQWGRSWQSPMWAAWAGLAAMVGWPSIPYAHDRQRVLDMLTVEANYVVTQRPPLFWCDKDGAVLRPGDSAAEENSWCAMVLWVAAALLPTHESASAWLRAAQDLCVSAFARPGEDSRGYNVTASGLVVNHNRVHPDYMTTVSQNYWGPVLGEYMRREWNPNVVFPGTYMFDALTSSPMDSEGTVAYDRESPTIKFPVGVSNDWGTRRPAAHAALAGLALRTACRWS